MLRQRVIPCLLLRGSGFVKTVRFKEPKYVGDAMNAVRIFNEKEAGEIILLDIEASGEGRDPRYDVIEDIVSECFMPVAYGGGVTNVDQVARLFQCGVEKVAINTAAHADIQLVESAAARFGGQSVVGAFDVSSKLLGGHRVVRARGRQNTKIEPVVWARRLADAGAGELVVQSVTRDGTKKGYDLDLVRAVVDAVDVPVIAVGGAGGVADLAAVFHHGGAAAAGVGSMVVFHGKHDAVLITMPEQERLDEAMAQVRRESA
jgi:cyclase